MGLKINIINRKKIIEPNIFQLEDYLNYKEMFSYVGYFNLIKKLDLILPPSSELPLYIGNCEFMNINYAFNYLLNKSSMKINLSESIFSGGKGDNFYKTICSSLGEAFERFMGCLEYFNQKDALVVGTYNELHKLGLNAINPEELKIFSKEQLEEKNFLFDDFDKNTKISWIKMYRFKNNEEIYVPSCLILMYYSPKDKSEKRIGYATSGGLTSHISEDKCIEHGILEIIERHEINLSWYCKIPPKKIILDNITNSKLKIYENYIKENNIQFYLHNVDQQNFHVVTAISFDDDINKYAFNAGGGISEDIELAILSAIQEYAQSVNNTRKIIYAPSWITSIFSNNVLNVNKDDDPREFKTFYQAVSYYGLKEHSHKLDWYIKNNINILLSDIQKNQPKLSILDYIKDKKIDPIYLKLKVDNNFKYIHIAKIFMTEFSSAFIAGFPAFGHKSYSKYLRKNESINSDILPFP